MEKSQIENDKVECMACLESMKRVVLNNSFLGDNYAKELRDTDKHEIIVKIAEILGDFPSNIQKAENIFELMKYLIANYIVHHEYCSVKGVDADFLLWLDSKSNPQFALQVTEFFSRYIK
ncbi:MAG: hypothetical protein MUC95_10210 [Spirochaetes bacterium]|nr:hypothetical protein [Spirochaetota bacterium]